MRCYSLAPRFTSTKRRGGFESSKSSSSSSAPYYCSSSCCSNSWPKCGSCYPVGISPSAFKIESSVSPNEGYTYINSWFKLSRVRFLVGFWGHILILPLLFSHAFLTLLLLVVTKVVCILHLNCLSCTHLVFVKSKHVITADYIGLSYLNFLKIFRDNLSRLVSVSSEMLFDGLVWENALSVPLCEHCRGSIWASLADIAAWNLKLELIRRKLNSHFLAGFDLAGLYV